MLLVKVGGHLALARCPFSLSPVEMRLSWSTHSPMVRFLHQEDSLRGGIGSTNVEVLKGGLNIALCRFVDSSLHLQALIIRKTSGKVKDVGRDG